MKEAFVPLAYPLGHAQVDFGQCVGIIGVVRTVLALGMAAQARLARLQPTEASTAAWRFGRVG
jgi:hypothetical protein